jgi:hypothetical protein
MISGCIAEVKSAVATTLRGGCVDQVMHADQADRAMKTISHH